MKKLFAILLCLAMVLSLAACVATKPAETIPEKGGETTALKKFMVIVVHADGSQKEFSYESAEAKLGAFLEAQNLIESEGADDGMFHTVDGEKAVYETDKAYWAFYLGEDYAMTGIYDTDITDGATYKLVYTPA